MGQIHNVLIILAITLLMAAVTTVLAYFVDFMPPAIGNRAQLATIVSAIAQTISGAR